MFESLIALDELEQGKHRELRNNQIWQLLNTRNEVSLEQLRSISANAPVQTGWLALLQTLRDVQQQGLDYRSSVATWQQQYYDHPATQMLDSYNNNDLVSLLEVAAPSGQISLMGTDAVAVLLPFDQRLTKFSNAIRDGLLSAKYESGSSREIRIYDVGSNANDALSVYQQAAADGAQLIIGPLRRDALDSIVRYGNLSVPLIALNYLPYGGAENLIQFGLSPEDEARDAVSYMMQAGLSTAAMILPDTEAGARSGEAFKQQLERWGGKVVASETLDGSSSDYRKELSALLLINESLQRRRNIQAALDTSLVFETHTRTDLDAIFAPVSPEIGRVLKPQLDFHNAGDVPLLASSSIYNGKPQPDRDNDLNGTLFNDMPWLVAPRKRSESNLHSTASKLSLDSGPLARFFALGVDAFRITEELGNLLASSEYTIEGATGRLQLSNDRRIMRQLAWAQFEGGAPKAISFDYGPINPPPPVDSLLDEQLQLIPIDTDE
ncbi:penicillin-binding protein activator LpoA-like [Oratosquilla oratoria]|uniref:penicillin-binding protein activator LpoA-like n=1 Tax=Oratosquilla oratoria TaxID=337810 RepID=UPI003F768533